MPRTGTHKQELPCIRLARGKFKLTNQDSAGGKKLSVLQGSCGVRTTEMTLLETLSSMSPTFMTYAKMHKLFPVLLYALCVFRSPLHIHGGKKQKAQLHRVRMNLRKEIKGKNVE